MLSPIEVAKAAHILAERRRSGVQAERLPGECRPMDLDSALAVQSAVTRELGSEVGGWKCLLPPPDRLVVAPILASDIHRDVPVPVWAPDGVAKIEPELAFVFDRDLPARDEAYSSETVQSAIAHTHLVLELIHSRYADPAAVEFPELLADGLLNQGLFIGPEVDPDLAVAASEMAITVHSQSGAPETHAGRHPNTHPRAPLEWLVDFLRDTGAGIKAGDIVITGSYAGVLEVPLEEPVRVQFGELGELSVAFKARVQS
ncbi:fumarylacetoacetate hydrolase family protein [Marinimicrobium sp. ARAG 43.8]|uniref:fumarylacetoacetate hydrolase family protein n=1 Tax=Marinimicrobium sp. ARAG 43.8 TaxID=3418719 RepID=UPI003CEF5F00